MTKDETIEAFYNNYEAFCIVADYLLQKTGYSGIGISGDKVVAYNNKTGSMVVETYEIDTFEVGEQLKLICGVGFNGAGKDTDSTRIYFSTPFDTGTQGVIYVPGGLEDARAQDKLGKKDWYYFQIKYD